MTIDEAIKHAEEVAEKEEERINKTFATFGEDRPLFKVEENECKKCAEEHRQLAEWLKDYKRLLEQDSSTDAVSRQAVLDFMQLKIGGKELYKSVYELPPVKPIRKKGHWITKIKSDLRNDMWPTNPKCSECGGEPYFSNTIYNYKFCPYCGAEMENVENDK